MITCRTRADRLIHTPMGMEMTMAVNVAAIISAMVVMASSQRSMTPRNTSDRRTMTGNCQRRVASQAMPTRIAMISHQGVAISRSSMDLSSISSG
ncbi:hypothetical protein D3C87_1538330 [compost metagenome]